MRQMLGNLLRCHVAQNKLQTAAQYGNGDFVRIGGRQNEFNVFRRLFQSLQHGIERAFGKHMHFVDDIDFVFTRSRRVLCVFQHFADIVDTGIRCRVDFQ